MAKQRVINTNQPSAVAPRKVRIVGSDTFFETLSKYKDNAAVLTGLRNFVAQKRDAPLQAYGGKDYPFIGSGPLRGYIHAGITRDISIIYTISGRDPHVLKLYGLYSHNEIGTGTPNRPAVSKKMAGVFSGQSTFRPLEKIDESTKPVNSQLLVDLLSLI